MFGPNTYFKDDVEIKFSHRDQIFFDLFERVNELFTEKFNLQDYDILFIPGSGTIGIEAMMFSMDYKINFIGNDGTFRDRLIQLYKNYEKEKSRTNKVDMFVHLETSISKPFDNGKGECLVDAISAFPYYDIPKGTKVFITCLNKQIGSYIGLSVVGVRRDQWKYCKDEKVFSYLNLKRYVAYLAQNQTPHTTPTFIYEHLYKVLTTFNIERHREKIDTVSKLICDNVPYEMIIGDHRCPVITVNKYAFTDEVAKKYDLYGYWTGKPCYQFFTYTQPIQDYIDFFQAIKK